MKKKSISVVYLNATADVPHVGCLAVTYAHLKKIFSRGFNVKVYGSTELKFFWKNDLKTSLKIVEQSILANDISSSDIVIINAEGTIHHNKGLHLLAISSFSQSIGVPVFLLNATIDDVNGFDDIFRKMKDIVVREEYSYLYLRGKNINCRFCVDDFINADFNQISNKDIDKKYLITDWHPHVESLVLPIVKKINNFESEFAPMYYENAYNDWQNIIVKYSMASLVIAGRYHSIYAAGLAGVPFVALPVNSHKSTGIIKSSGLPIPFCKKSSHINNQIKYALDNPLVFQEFKSFLEGNKGEQSFEMIDIYTDITVTNKVLNSVPKTYRIINQFKKTGQNIFNNNIKKQNIKLAEKRIDLDNKLIVTHKYDKWLEYNSSKTYLNGSFQFLFNMAVCYFSLGNFSLAEKYFQKIRYINPAIVNINLAKLYIELGDTDSLKNIIKNEKLWSNEKYLYYLDIHHYKNAWSMTKYRDSSQELIYKKRHYLTTNSNENILIVLEGGIGDQIRHTILFNEINLHFTKVTIACDERLHSLFKRNFSYFSYELLDNVDRYNNIFPILDLYETISPSSSFPKSFINPNSILKEYWNQEIKDISSVKKVIGICQGTHIQSYERLSNIFDYDIWKGFIEKYSDEYIFINLSHDYNTNDIEEITNFHINLYDDFENLSALMSCCDIVITPPNTILDLAGSLNIKTYALSTGYKFRFRIMNNFNDLFYDNIVWVNNLRSFSKAEVLSEIKI